MALALVDTIVVTTEALRYCCNNRSVTLLLSFCLSLIGRTCRFSRTFNNQPTPKFLSRLFGYNYLIMSDISVNSDSSLSGDDLNCHHFVMEAEMLQQGLELLGYTERQIGGSNSNRKRFKSAFGASPTTLCTIYEDLQKTAIVLDDGFILQIDGNETSLKWFLISFHFLKKYPTDRDKEYIFNVSERYSRDRIWDMLKRIRGMKADKITWPDDLGRDDIWIMSVDGTHCCIAEPRHPEWSQDREYYSHKYNKAGINYELGISLASQKLIWMNGPYKAGTNDVTVFKKKLRRRLEMLGKKAIGDSGYNGHQAFCVTPNKNDSDEVKKFKSRALKRHESFNGMTKTFQSLSGRFRHPVDKFPIVFEAICVICQYKIESEEPLFDILIEDVLIPRPPHR